MKNEFSEAMSKRTDEELIQIVNLDRDNYQGPAIEAAEEEIKKRGIDTVKVEKVKAELSTKMEEQVLFDGGKVGSGIRLLNYIIDSIIVFFITIVLIFVFSILFTLDNPNLIDLVGIFSLLLAFFGYYIFMENKFQKTLGKFVTKSRVARVDRGILTQNDIIRRTFCRLIPFDNITFLFTKNGFHDRLSDTTVIKDEAITI